MARTKKRSDGRYQRKIVIDGKTKFFYGKTEKEISKKIEQYIAEKDKQATFSQMADAWYESFIAEKPLSQKYAKPNHKRLTEYFGDTPISDITVKDVSVYLQSMARQKYALNTVKNSKSVLSCIFKYAIVNGEIDTNPCDYAKVPSRLKKTPRSAPTEQEMEIIKNSVGCTFGLFYYMALYTGMRRGELVALKWSDIDFKSNLINVNKSAAYVSNKGIIKDTKTESGERQIPLLNDLKAVLMPLKSHGYIFSDNGFTPLTNHSIEYRISRYKAETGLNITPHQCRHGYATILYEAGIDERMAMELLGHANISTTKNIYTHISNSKKTDATTRLNEFLKSI